MRTMNENKNKAQMDGYKFPVSGGGITDALGVSAAGIHAGFRKNPAQLDVALVTLPEHTTAAGMFTQNVFCAAPVQVSRGHVANGHARAIILNSGNANAATGEKGLQVAEASAQMVGEALSVAPEDVLIASTGVIGVQLPLEPFETGIPQLVSGLGVSDGTDTAGSIAAARAIMTTDTFPKHASIAVELAHPDGSETTVHLGGMCKGSGMIMPNMATMLAVLTCDATIEHDALVAMLHAAVNRSFNKVTVDSDTSTNDTVFFAATGALGGEAVTASHPWYPILAEALGQLCEHLARQIASDGEGASKLVTVEVTGAADAHDADLAARAIANSPLVKTAVAGHDANWGRVAAAIGKSGARFAQENVSIDMMGMPVMRNGLPVPFSEEEALRRFEEPEIVFAVDLGAGEASTRIWTCDFTHGYITINADYRT